MSFPAPTSRQAKILWFSITTLAVGVVLALSGLLIWGVSWVVNQLSSVLLPLAIAGIIAYLLDPLVDRLERHGTPRARGILLVFFLAVMCVLILLATIVPQLLVEISNLTTQLTSPQFLPKLTLFIEKTRDSLGNWLSHSSFGTQARHVWDEKLSDSAQVWFNKQLPVATNWLISKLTQVASWAGFLAGLALVPVYVFYFLLEKKGIQDHWTNYLPVKESKVKQELVFVLNAINECLIVFFRGQVLVALCDGALLTVGFFAVGLNYALLLGMVAGILSIVPYLGVMISLIPAVVLAIVQYGDWLHPLLVLGIFALVQMAEGFYISPKIIGDRVGLHPLTIIVAVMVGTTLLGGILGGVLAIPLTAVLRTLMFRYVWKNPKSWRSA